MYIYREIYGYIYARRAWSSAGRRRGLRKERRALGSPCSSSGPLGEETGIMGGTTILGLHPPGPFLLDPMEKNSLMEAMPLSPVFL